MAFEGGTVAPFPDLSFSDPIYIHLHSLFQEKDETKNLGCDYKTLQKPQICWYYLKWISKRVKKKPILLFLPKL